MATQSCSTGTVPGVWGFLVLKFGVAKMPHSSQSSRGRRGWFPPSPWGTSSSSPSVLEEGEGRTKVVETSQAPS